MNVILTVNGGSSSIKFAVFEASNPPVRLLLGEIERVGQPGTVISVKGLGDDVKDQPVDATDQTKAADQIVSLLRKRLGDRKITGIGHRVVHGGLKLVDHQIITPQVTQLLREATEFDAAHLPREIGLIQTIGDAFSDVTQIACFDTAFHKDLPTVSKMLPVPRKYFEQGVRRLGFHGLSFSYLLKELRHVAGGATANGKVILAHLGSGASMAAVKNGKPIDTTMGLTPLAGIMMGTRPGDLDAGFLVHLLRSEKISADQMDELLNNKCGLLGVSDTTSDMRDLFSKRNDDPRAAEAIDLFCYSARKMIGAYAAALGGLDTLVFSGGIGEHSVEARAEICRGLEFLGIQISDQENKRNYPVISTGRVIVRVIPTDEEAMIAQTVFTFVK